MKIRYLLLVLATCMLVTAASHFRTMAAETGPKRIEVTAKRFSYDPSEVTLKVGDPVVLAFTSTDVPHGIRFKDLNLDAKVTKGKISELAFTPTEVGNFVGHCSVFCGSGHGSMTMTLHVVK